MSGLDDINIAVIDIDDSEGGLRENVRAILQEIATMLEALVESGADAVSGETRAIDIRSLPLLPGDYEALEDGYPCKNAPFEILEELVSSNSMVIKIN